MSNDWPTSPNSHWHFAQALRFAADDLKSYYIEAATTGDGQPSATQLADWFWEGTIAGRVLTIVRQNLLESDDKAAVDIGDGSIVPRSRV